METLDNMLISVDRSCFCCTVQAGTKIFAGVFCALDLLLFLISCLIIQFLDKESTAEEYIDVILGSILYFAAFVIDVVLIIGLLLDNEYFMKAWIYTSLVIISLFIIITLVVFTKDLIGHEPLSDIVSHAFVLTLMALRFYAVIVVSSHCKNITLQPETDEEYY